MTQFTKQETIPETKPPVYVLVCFYTVFLRLGIFQLRTETHL